MVRRVCDWTKLHGTNSWNILTFSETWHRNRTPARQWRTETDSVSQHDWQHNTTDCAAALYIQLAFEIWSFLENFCSNVIEATLEKRKILNCFQTSTILLRDYSISIMNLLKFNGGAPWRSEKSPYRLERNGSIGTPHIYSSRRAARHNEKYQYRLGPAI